MIENSVKKTILIVDDEEPLRSVLAQRFNIRGFKTVTASGGRPAFELLHEQNVDLVISDMRMPDGDGMGLLDALKRERRLVPFVFITGFSDYSDEEIFDRGAQGIFTKPDGMKFLFDKAQEILNPEGEHWNRRSGAPNKLNFTRIYPSPAQAERSREIRLGRGGFCIRHSGAAPALQDEISFDIKFETGVRPGHPELLAGEGLIRWTSSSKAASGIEITFLEAESREFLAAWNYSHIVDAYIPSFKA